MSIRRSRIKSIMQTHVCGKSVIEKKITSVQGLGLGEKSVITHVIPYGGLDLHADSANSPLIFFGLLEHTVFSHSAQ